MVYACLAITTDFDLLTKSSFGSITLTEVNGKFTENIEVDIGLRAVALNNPLNDDVGKVVVRFDQFCDLSDNGLDRYMSEDDCNACNDISSNMVISVIIATISFLPSFFSDVLRMYSGYDVNCQKFCATIFASFTVFLMLNTLFTYKLLCADKFYEGIIGFDEEGIALPLDVPVDSGEYVIDFEYRWGWGLIFLATGTFLKFADIFFHFCLSTPTVTRNREEQGTYEKVKVENLP
jgi:hypothetical protein